MSTKPYTQSEITTFIMTIHKPNVPDLLELILQAPNYDDLDDDGIERFGDLFYHCNSLFNYDPLISREEKLIMWKDMLADMDTSTSYAKGRYDNLKEHIEFVENEEETIDFYRLIKTKLSKKYLSELVVSEWRRVEFHYNYMDTWKTIFSSISIRDEDRNLEELPEGEFTVYRGGTKEGLSWTTSIEQAKWFHNRNKRWFSQKDEHNYLLKMSINKDEVIFYTNDRSEAEVVLFPNQDKIVVMPNPKLSKLKA